MTDPNILTNDNFEVLSALYDKRDSKGISRTPQQEIADELHKSRPKVVQIFKKLKDSGYLEKIEKRECCYKLTPEAIKVIEFFRKNNWKLEQKALMFFKFWF